MKACSDAEKELATYVCCGEWNAIFDLFADNDDASEVSAVNHSSLTFEEHRLNAMQVKHFVPDQWCGLCLGEHPTARCSRLNGICFRCGNRGYNCRCQAQGSVSGLETVADNSTCISCKIALYPICGIQLHTGGIGFECKFRALADCIKMLLLAGVAAGQAFGPQT
jgi:hypothetical protein